MTTHFGFDGAHGTDVRPPHIAATKLWAKDESVPGADDGTRLTAALVNALVGTLRELVETSGITATESDDTRVRRAVVALIAATYAPLASPTFTGTPAAPTAAPGTSTTQLATTAFVAAAIAALLNSAPGALDTLDELAAALGDDANFAATMVAALAGKQPLDADLSAIAAFAPVKGRLLVGDGTNWNALETGADGLALVLDAAQSLGVKWSSVVSGASTLTANRTYYVRTDGSDTNDGLTNSAGGAFLTVQKAIDIAASLNLGPYSVTINVQPGTYSQALTLKPFVSAGGGITITGGATAIITSGGNTITMNGATGWTISGGIRLETTNAGSYVIQLQNHSRLTLGGVDFSSTAYAHIFASGKSKISASSPYTISAGANFHAYVENGEIGWGGQTVTLTGSPAFGVFVGAIRQSYITSFVTWSGAATGQQYNADYLSIIQASNAFPGSSAGSATNGSYKI